MNKAPSVSYWVGPSLFQRGLAPLLWLLNSVCLLSFLDQTPHSSGRLASVGLVLCLAAAVAWGHWCQRDTAQLSWDGQCWRLQPSEQISGQVQVQLDWQSGMLVTFQAVGERPCWLWLRQASSPAQWGDLRRALWAPQDKTALTPLDARP